MFIFGKIAQAAFLAHDVDQGLGHFAAHLEVGLGAERRLLAGRYNLFGYVGAQAVDGRKGRQDLTVADGELRRRRAVDIDVHEGKTAQAHFLGQFQRRIEVLLDLRCALALGGDFLHGPFLPFQAVDHSRQLEGLGANREESAVVGQRLVDLIPGDAEGHHDVGHGVGPREEVADLMARVDEPLRDMAGFQLPFVVRRLLAQFIELVDALALTDIFHDLETRLGLDAVLDEIVHDVVTRRDGFLQGNRARRNQVLGIVQPDVGAVGETGNADQFRKGLGLGVDEHLADERRAKFRDAQAADFRAQLFRRHAQGLGRTEQAQGGQVIKGNGRRLDAGHIFEHTDDRRIIMAEDVELDQTAFDGVIIEMGRNDAAVLLVGRVLDRREMMDVHVAGNDHDAARMLARRILDARAAGDEAVDVSVVDLDTLGVGPLHDVAISRLILDGADGPGAEDVVLAEQFFRIFMGFRMVFAGEIEVDIRNLVAVEAQENSERDVVAILVERRAAMGADLVRQVETAAHFAVRKEFAPLALGADIMRRQGVDFGNVRHGRHEGRTDGPTGADEVAVVIGVLDQLVGDVIEDAETVAQDGRKFFFQPVFDDLRQRVAVDFVGLLVAHVLQRFRRTGDLREIERFLRYRPAVGNHIVDLIGVGNDHFPRPFFAEIGKFRQHLVCRAQVQVRLKFGILEALAGHEDFPVNLVFRVHEMSITRGDSQFPQIIAELEDSPVDVAQAFFIGDEAFADEEAVVGEGLDFQIIVERRDFLQLFIRQLLLDHGPHQFAGFTSRTQDEAFAVFRQDRPGDARPAAVDIFQMGNADQFIEIADADLVLGQDDDVVRLVDLIVKEIAFHAVNDLDVVGLIRRNFLEQRERLDDAVVGDGDGRMAPLLDSLDELLDRDQGVHVAHDRMQVEFDARRRIVVFPFHRAAVGFHHVVGHEDVVVLVIIILDIAVDPDIDAGLELLDQVVVFFRRQRILAAVLAATALIADVEELLGRNAVGAVGHLEGQEGTLRLELAELDLDDLALEDDVVLFLAEDVVDGDGIAAKGPAHPDPAVTAGLGAATLTALLGAAVTALGRRLAGLLIIGIVVQFIVDVVNGIIAVFVGNPVAFHIVSGNIGDLTQRVVVGYGQGHVAAVENRRHAVFDRYRPIQAQFAADPVAEQVHVADSIRRLGLDMPGMAGQIRRNRSDGHGTPAIDGNQNIIFRNNMPDFHIFSFLYE